MGVRREEAILASMPPGQWLTWPQILALLPPDCREGYHPGRSTAATLRRMARRGLLDERKERPPGRGHYIKFYKLKEEIDDG